MTTQHTRKPHTLADAAIHEILHGTMPDGSRISVPAKVDAMFAVAGIENPPKALKVILGRGIMQGRARKERAGV